MENRLAEGTGLRLNHLHLTHHNLSGIQTIFIGTLGPAYPASRDRSGMIRLKHRRKQKSRLLPRREILRSCDLSEIEFPENRLNGLVLTRHRDTGSREVEVEYPCPTALPARYADLCEVLLTRREIDVVEHIVPKVKVRQKNQSSFDLQR